MAESWRDRVRIHPAADDLFDMMNTDELDELSKDIAKHGLKIPLMWVKTENGDALLDGRNRCQAINQIPDKTRREELWYRALKYRHYLDPDADAVAYVISANLHRRQLLRGEG